MGHFPSDQLSLRTKAGSNGKRKADHSDFEYGNGISSKKQDAPRAIDVEMG
jgi:hypothetical protein